MLDLKSRSESLISGDQWPFLVLFLLFLFPYMLYTPSILFPIRNAIDNSEHIFYSFFFAILLYFSVSFGNFLGVSIVDIFGFDSFRSDHPNAVYLALLYFLLYLCIAAHIYLIVVGGSGYTEGGFLEARESFITKGIGIPLRLYMIVVPLILANGAYSRALRQKVILVCALVCIRAFILSERMAMLELAVMLWYCSVAMNVKVSVRRAFNVAIPIVLIFYLTIQVRLAFQSQFDSSIGDESLINTFMIYYADTTNKFYLTFLYDLTYPLTSWNAIYRELFSAAASGKDIWDDAYFGLTASDPRILLALNNPGGLAQDISDFGIFVGMFLIFAKFGICSFVMTVARKSSLFLAIAPLFVVHVLEYNRFNYLYLPFTMALLCIAIVLGFYGQVVSVAQRRRKE